MTDFKEENRTITLTIPTQGSIPVTSISNWIFFMLRRVTSAFSWTRMWNDYKDGFGSYDSDNYWMGLERLHQLTTSGSYRLRIEWQKWSNGDWFSVEYWFFYVEDEAAGYKLHVTGYVPGDDGRAMTLCVYVTVFTAYTTRTYSMSTMSTVIITMLVVCHPLSVHPSRWYLVPTRLRI